MRLWRYNPSLAKLLAYLLTLVAALLNADIMFLACFSCLASRKRHTGRRQSGRS